MIPQIKHHPSRDMLAQFNRGQLPAGISTAIAAHLDLCSCCREQSAELVEQASAQWFDDSAEPGAVAELDDLLESIVSQPQQVPRPAKAPVSERVHLLEHSVQVPEILAKAAGESLHWKKLPGGISLANLSLDNKAQCDFLYMKPGSQIPRHKHQGIEITLVLDGTFTDDRGDYRPGDFIVKSGEDCHGASSDEGCLCFTVLESPVIFTSGLARLFNPLNRVLFNRATK